MTVSLKLKSFGTIQIRLSEPALTAVLEHLCHTANNLINTGIYHARQMYFEENIIVGKHDLSKLLKHNANFEYLYSHAAQQSLIGVAESFASYRQLKKCAATRRDAKLPKYRRSGGMASISYPAADLTFKNDLVRVPLGVRTKKVFGIGELLLDPPSGIALEQIKGLRILPRNNEFYAEWVCRKPMYQADVDLNLALGIDAGVTNWLTCVSNLGKSFIVCGRKIKSINRYFNKRIAKLKSGKPKDYWDDDLAALTERRNRQMRDARNKAARLVVNYCLKNRIGNVVFGWNKGVKDSIKLGDQNNQNFVAIPTAKLKDRISELCDEYGIRFIETEESYTSVSSFIDRDPLPKFGGKPEQVKFSGRRVKRGLYSPRRSKSISADANAAANMLRKAMIHSSELIFDLSKVSREVLSLPKRYCVFKDIPTRFRDHYLLRLQPL